VNYKYQRLQLVWICNTCAPKLKNPSKEYATVVMLMIGGSIMQNHDVFALRYEKINLIITGRYNKHTVMV
jgi:hypothetical protein